ncbi:MAG: hypothetical protein WA099_09010, partial [Sulfuricurvum sp.]
AVGFVSCSSDFVSFLLFYYAKGIIPKGVRRILLSTLTLGSTQRALRLRQRARARLRTFYAKPLCGLTSPLGIAQKVCTINY